MNYPHWLLAIPGGMLIARIAVPHVFVSHFAIGGGFFLVSTEGRARRQKDAALLDYCRRQKTNIVPRREVQRNVTPVNLRQRSVLEDALRELIEAGRVLLVQEGRRKEIHVNPALLEGGAE